MTLEKGKQFTNNGYLETNLEKLARYLIGNKDKDLFVIVCGAPGTAKSSLTMLSENYLRGRLEWLEDEPNEDDGLPIDWENMAFNHEKWSTITKTGKKKFKKHDEGRSSFNRRNAMTSNNKEAIDDENQHRFRNDIKFVNFQHLYDAEPQIVKSRAHVVIRCVKQGWFWFYNQQKINKFKYDDENKKINFPEPVFKGSFPDPEKQLPNTWKKYKRLEDEEMNGSDEDEKTQELSISQIVELVKKRRDYYKKEYGDKQIINQPLVETDFDIGGRKARKVKAKVEADLGIGQ